MMTNKIKIVMKDDERDMKKKWCVYGLVSIVVEKQIMIGATEVDACFNGSYNNFNTFSAFYDLYYAVPWSCVLLLPCGQIIRLGC